MLSAEGHLLVGWAAMLLGVVSGAVIGVFFHDAQWMGGYGSFPRRLVRLGHIAFFGLGLINVAFGLTWQAVDLAPGYAGVASWGFLVSVATMSACCFLTAWRTPFRFAFPVPVLSALAGIGGLLLGWTSG